MLRYSLHENEAALAIEDAVSRVLKDGYLTGDLMASGASPYPVQSTSMMGDKITEYLA